METEAKGGGMYVVIPWEWSKNGNGNGKHGKKNKTTLFAFPLFGTVQPALAIPTRPSPAPSSGQDRLDAN